MTTACADIRHANMASARKKQDEKHLKILRELVSIAGNKQCFDCHQRGPTYVNMTIGSFVCTSCSGMLRGLTPPHRVKSISMASFTPEEIEMIKSRGNEYCKRIWLGLYETSHQQESKDEQQIKDFMVAKYEKKRYYLDPSQAGISLNKNGPTSTPTPVSPAPSQSSPRMASSSHEVKPLSSLLGPGVRSIVLGHHQASSSTDNIHSASTGLTSTSSTAPWLRDFGSKDPFSSSTPSLAASSNTSTPQQPSFANFDNNPIFSSQTFQSAKSESVHPRYNTNRWSMPTPAALTSMGSAMSSFAGTLLSASSSVGAPPDEDRYAALKDLDSLMKSSGGAGGGSMSNVENGSSVQPDWPMASSSSPWTPQPAGLYGGGVFGSPPASVGVTAPPQHLYHGSPSMMEGHSNGSASLFSPPFSSPASSNPFAENTVGGQGNWASGTPVMGVLSNGTHPGASSGAYHSSQTQSVGNMASPFMPAYSTTKPQWSSPVGNPFLVGPRPPSASAHSSNPFL